VSRAEAAHNTVLSVVIAKRRTIANLTTIAQLQSTEVAPRRQALQDSITALSARVRSDVAARQHASSRQATRSIIVVVALGLLAVACAAVIAVRMNRDLRREVGAAVGHIQS